MSECAIQGTVIEGMPLAFPEVVQSNGVVLEATTVEQVPDELNISAVEPPPATVEVASSMSVRPIPVNDKRVSDRDELDNLVNQDTRVSTRDAAEFGWNGSSGKFSVSGLPTRLALILGSMVVTFGITVYNSHDVKDAYIPMSMIGGSGILILYIERKK